MRAPKGARVRVAQSRCIRVSPLCTSIHLKVVIWKSLWRSETRGFPLWDVLFRVFGPRGRTVHSSHKHLLNHTDSGGFLYGPQRLSAHHTNTQFIHTETAVVSCMGRRHRSLITHILNYRGFPPTRKRNPPRPYRRPMPRVLGWSRGEGRVLISEVPL